MEFFNVPDIDLKGYYSSLKYLDLRKCDYVPDKWMLILKMLRPYVTILNYYGVEVYPYYSENNRQNQEIQD